MLRLLVARLDPPIDYVGQSMAYRLMCLVFGIGYTTALLAGVVLNDLVYTVYLGIATFIAAFVVVVPSWGFYRRNLLKFRTPRAKGQ